MSCKFTTPTLQSVMNTPVNMIVLKIIFSNRFAARNHLILIQLLNYITLVSFNSRLRLVFFNLFYQSV